MLSLRYDLPALCSSIDSMDDEDDDQAAGLELVRVVAWMDVSVDGRAMLPARRMKRRGLTTRCVRVCVFLFVGGMVGCVSTLRPLNTCSDGWSSTPLEAADDPVPHGAGHPASLGHPAKNHQPHFLAFFSPLLNLIWFKQQLSTRTSTHNIRKRRCMLTCMLTFSSRRGDE